MLTPEQVAEIKARAETQQRCIHCGGIWRAPQHANKTCAFVVIGMRKDDVDALLADSDEFVRRLGTLEAASAELVAAEASVRMEHSTPEYRRYAEALRKLTACLAPAAPAEGAAPVEDAQP